MRKGGGQIAEVSGEVEYTANGARGVLSRKESKDIFGLNNSVSARQAKMCKYIVGAVRAQVYLGG